jgi:hypothetical protein
MKGVLREIELWKGFDQIRIIFANYQALAS